MAIRNFLLTLIFYTCLTVNAQVDSATDVSGKAMNRYGYNTIFFHDSIYILAGIQEILYSKDGANWEKTTIKNSKYFTIDALTYFKGRFIGVGHNRSRKMLMVNSTDGKNWECNVLPEKMKKGLYGSKSGIGLWGIASNDSVAVACGARGLVLYSSNGSDWAKIKLEDDDISPFFSVCWTGERFIAVGAFGRIITSQNGKTWKTANSTNTNHLYDVVASNTGSVATGNNGTILFSKTGVNWIDAVVDTSENDADKITSIVRVDEKFIAIGYKAIIKPLHLLNNLQFGKHCAPFTYFYGPEFVCYTSEDGNKWTKLNFQSEKIMKGLQDLLWDGKQFIAVANFGLKGTNIIRSTDGKSWIVD